MEYTGTVPSDSDMPSPAWPYYHYPQQFQFEELNPYFMSHPWSSEYMPMYPYSGYDPTIGSDIQENPNQHQQQNYIKPFQVDVAHSPNAKRRRINKTITDPIPCNVNIQEHQTPTHCWQQGDLKTAQYDEPHSSHAKRRREVNYIACDVKIHDHMICSDSRSSPYTYFAAEN